MGEYGGHRCALTVTPTQVTQRSRADTVLPVSRRQSVLLYAFSLWTIWIWGTRIWNIWNDDARSAGFKAVHTVLAVVSVVLAVAAGFVVRNIRRARQTD